MEKEKIYPVLETLEMQKLVYKAQQGDALAMEKVIYFNQGLIISLVKKFYSIGIAFNDLKQEAYCGLMKAIRTYDKTKKCAFSTYATKCMQNEIVKCLKGNVEMITLPKGIIQQVITCHNVREKIYQETGKEASIKEIADIMHISPAKALILYNYQFKELSLDYKYDNLEYKNGIILKNVLIDKEENSPIEEVISSDLKERVSMLLEEAHLSSNEIKVVMYRFGFINNRIYTHLEIGKIINLNRERVRQIEAKALYKLRNTKNILDFLIFMQNPREASANLDYFKNMYQNEKNHYKTYIKENRKIS